MKTSEKTFSYFLTTTEIATCKKEARESKFFIRMVVRAVPELRDEGQPLWQEAKELHLIFAKISRR